MKKEKKNTNKNKYQIKHTKMFEWTRVRKWKSIKETETHSIDTYN